MLYTPSQGLPYPASRREAANAPLASELLARATDKKLSALSAAWAAEMVGPTVTLTLSTNITGISNNSDWPVFMDTVERQQPPSPTAGNQTVSPGTAGWYHCFFNIHMSPEGTVNANTLRLLHVDINGDPDPLLNQLVTEKYQAIDYEQNGSVGLGVEFVTFLRPSFSVTAYVLHNNTSSTCRIDASLSTITYTKICGEV